VLISIPQTFYEMFKKINTQDVKNDHFPAKIVQDDDDEQRKKMLSQQG
jgi:hypothetical protein